MVGEMLRVVIMGLLLVAIMVPKTMAQLHPQYKIGLILSSPSDEKVLLESGLFVLDDGEDAVWHSFGRSFYFGSLNNVSIVYVVALSPLISVSQTVDFLFSRTDVNAVIDYGNAATISDSVKLGDVAVISEAAFTSAWTWQERERSVDATNELLPSLKFGDYNKPRPGDNKFGSIQYNKVIKYIPGDRDGDGDRSIEETFWHSVDPKFFEIASKLKDMNVLGRSCIENMCTNASIVHGVRASSSDAYVQNSAYGRFLRKALNVSTIDMKSAATISTINLRDYVNYIIFRAASNRPGENKDPKVSALARENNLKVVLAFIQLLHNESSSTPNDVL